MSWYFFNLAGEIDNEDESRTLSRIMPVLPVDLFRELNNKVPNITIQPVNHTLKQMLYDAFDTNKKDEWTEKIKTFEGFNSEADLTFREYLMISIFKIFSGRWIENDIISRKPPEILYNRSIDRDHHVTFIRRNRVKAMAAQLKDERITDKRLRYNADGTILFNRNSTELLLSEVSSAFLYWKNILLIRLDRHLIFEIKYFF
ncbi:hypothetical protein BD770DRAFT_412407 [Pilaira anomala]|nr:hypothetical protein BD770DRAFT_412407 [Pilaira anomala]